MLRGLIRYLKILALVSTVTLVGALLFFLFTKQQQKRLARILQTSIEEKGQLVVATRVINVKIDIQENQENLFKKLFLGRRATVLADVKVLIGIDDLTQISTGYSFTNRCYYPIYTGKFKVLSTEILFPVQYYYEYGVIYSLTQINKDPEVLELLEEVKKQAIEETNAWISQNNPLLTDLLRKTVKQFVPQAKWCE